MQGSLFLDVGSVGSGSATGTVTVVLGETVVEIPVNESIASGAILQVDYSFEDAAPGRASLFYVADIDVGGQTFQTAGYAVIEVEEDQTTIVDTSSILSMLLSGSYTASGAVQITELSASESQTDLASVTISGSLSAIDVDPIFVYVNDNTFPVIVNPSSLGTASFSTTVTLDPGANQIFVIAVNSTGAVTVSDPISVIYTGSTEGAVMLGTLIWDTPTSDMDLHLWYYESTAPDLSLTAKYHCAFWNMDLDSILPNGSEPYGNLDVDDTEGEGPEHMTLIDYPDGYYIFAVNSYSLDEDDHAYCTFTVSVDGSQRTMQHNFTIANSEDYAYDMGAWARCFDVRVSNGTATILSPNSSFVYHEDALFKRVANKTKRPD